MKQEMSPSIKKEQSITKARGFLLVEILLASSLFIIFLTAFAGVFYYGMQSSVLAGDRSQAIMFAEEGQEALRSMKNINFSNVTDGVHGLVYSNNAWSFVGTQDTSGSYTRQVTVTTVDENRKDVTISVIWQQTPGRTGGVSFSGRVTNWKTMLNLGRGLTINSVVVNHGLSKNVTDFAPYKVGTTTIALASSTLFNPGTYAVSATANSNYTQTFSGDCDATGHITLTSSSSPKLCTITNEEKFAYVVATSTIINHGGTKILSDFGPFKVGPTTVTLGATTSIDSGSYLVTEATSSQYNLTYSGDCLVNGLLSIISGQTRTCMLTNEEANTSLSDGVLIYGDSTNVPKYRVYDHTTNMFASKVSAIAGSIGKAWVIKTSPTSHIALAGYYDASGMLTIMCFNGTTWTNEFTTQVGGATNRHRFDIEFEKSSGDALVFYSKSLSSGYKLGYRTKSGSSGCGSANWTGESLYTPARTDHEIMLVKLAQDKRPDSNTIAAVWSDFDDDLSIAIWDGTAWVNEPPTVSEQNVQKVLAPDDVEDVDIEYESLSGDLMVVWGNELGSNGTNGVRYRTCTGGTAMCTWGDVSTPPVLLDDATSLDISENPITNEMVFASIGKASGDLQVAYWNGDSWTGVANLDTSCTVPYIASKIVGTGWVKSALGTTRSVIVYSDLNSPNINWYVGNGSTFTRQPDFVSTPGIASPQGYMEIEMNKVNPEQLLYITSDNASDLFAKRLLFTGTSTFSWTNADSGVALETSLPQKIASPFAFTFWQK
jgi:Tfp pilus assembly protein PilV